MKAAAAVVASPSLGETLSSDATVPSAEDLGGLAPHWVFMYQRLSTEGDRRVSEAIVIRKHDIMMLAMEWWEGVMV